MPDFAHCQVQRRSRLLRLADVDAVAASLLAGGLAVLPTETGYLLAAVATIPEAVAAAFEVKGRARTATMHVACTGLAMARRFGMLDERAATLLGHFTPGPLSLVVPAVGTLLSDLVSRDGEVGIRVPDHPATQQVIAAVGEPLTATSLNASGGAPIGVDEASLRTLTWPDATVLVVVDDEAVAFDKPSTLLRVTGPALEVLREGPVSLAQARARLGE